MSNHLNNSFSTYPLVIYLYLIHLFLLVRQAPQSGMFGPPEFPIPHHYPHQAPILRLLHARLHSPPLDPPLPHGPPPSSLPFHPPLTQPPPSLPPATGTYPPLTSGPQLCLAPFLLLRCYLPPAQNPPRLQPGLHQPPSCAPPTLLPIVLPKAPSCPPLLSSPTAKHSLATTAPPARLSQVSHRIRVITYVPYSKLCQPSTSTGHHGMLAFLPTVNCSAPLSGVLPLPTASLRKPHLIPSYSTFSNPATLPLSRSAISAQPILSWLISPI